MQAVSDSLGPRLVVERSWLDTLANVAQSLVSLLIMIMLVMGVVLLYALRKSINELTNLVRAANTPLQQVISDARGVTSEVRTIAERLKTPIAVAGETLEDASERVQEVMDIVEGRLARFDTLVGIAQEEAEGAVIGAAALLRGLRAGSAVVRKSLGLARGSGRKRRRARERVARERAPRERARRDKRDAGDESGRRDAVDAGVGAEAPSIRSRAATHP
ncbi:MAG: hypothetical protein ABI910_05335 [Gemmatimonadota bacterium]